MDNASTIDRIGAGVSLASELLPVSVGYEKDRANNLRERKELDENKHKRP